MSSSFVRVPPPSGLRAIAVRFHQDFDLEEITFREALDRQVAALAPEERQQLRAEISEALRKYPEPLSFDEHFGELGAANWVRGEPRDELEALLSRL